MCPYCLVDFHSKCVCREVACHADTVRSDSEHGDQQNLDLEARVPPFQALQTQFEDSIVITLPPFVRCEAPVNVHDTRIESRAVDKQEPRHAAGNFHFFQSHTVRQASM